MALAAGMRGAGLEADELPVADGGEGTAEVFAAALGGEWRAAPASDPLGRTVEARYLVLEDGSAVVEAAEAVGLRRLAPGELDPLAASSRGLGELLAAIAGDASGPILVGLGDTATVDGGAGLLEVVGETLVGREVQVLCDVRNPLLGERGAARAFGPQKGASPEQVEVLEARLAAMDELQPYAELPGAGAAGGLGAALASLGGRLASGAAVVLERIDFAGQARASGPRRHGRGDARPLIDRGQGRRRGRECVPRARRALRALRRARRGASARHPAARAERRPRSSRGRSRGARRPASPSAARRRVAASPSSRASSRRAWRCSRRAAGTPTT